MLDTEEELERQGSKAGMGQLPIFYRGNDVLRAYCAEIISSVISLICKMNFALL